MRLVSGANTWLNAYGRCEESMKRVMNKVVMRKSKIVMNFSILCIVVSILQISF